MSYVFISYSHQDRDYARKLADHLLANGFDVWIDDRIDFGSRWMHEIFTAIDNSSAYIVIMTPRAYEREWVENERLYAKKRNKIVFPLLLEGEAFPDLGATQFDDVIGGKLPEAAFIERLATFAPRRATSGQDVAAAPQQQAKLERETAEIPPAEADAAVVAVPPQQAVSRARRSSRGLFVFAAALLIVAFGVVILVAMNPQLLAGTTPTPTPTATLSGGGHGEIAFVSDRDGNNEIYLVNADGSNPRNLTNNPGDDTEPAWSPDGTQIAFTSTGVENNSRTFIMDVDGSNVRRLLPESGGWDPAWSPDGTQIAFTAYGKNDSAEIFVVGTDGGNLHPVTNNSAYDGYAAWSPDGKQIVFVSEQDGNQEIYSMDVDGRNARRLTNNPTDDTNPAWSPDGKQIVFESEHNGNEEIYVMDTDGNNLHPLTLNPSDGYEPAWSPDGTRIVFMSYRESNQGELYVMNADGSRVRRLVDNPANDRFPAWRP